MTSAVAEGDDTVVVTFAPERSRDLPLTVAGLPVFSEAYYRNRDFEASTLEAPLGSGPYRVGRFEVGRFIEFERVADHWARDLPVAIGHNNFDRIRYEYYRDRDVAFEAFKAGAFTYREEFTSRIWNNGYDFGAIKDGRVKQEVLPDETPSGMQGWWLNTRREKFRDPRVREAVGLAFDFEWTNQNLMFGAYQAHRLVLREFGPEGGRQAVAGRAGAARAVARQGAGRGVRRAVLAAALGRLGPRPQSPAPRRRASARRRLPARRQRAAPAGRTALRDRVPRRDAEPAAAHAALRQESRAARYRGALAHRRCRAIPAARERLRFRRGQPPLQRRLDAGRAAAPDLHLALRGDQRLAEPRRHRRSGGRTRSSSGSSAPRRATSCASPAAPSTGCCAPDATGCRCGIRRPTASPIGTMFGRPAAVPKYDLGVPAIWWHDADKARRIGRG